LHCQGKGTLRPERPGKVHSCYEAGRDGWWLHRWLIEQGIDNIVVDAASIEVNRRARRAKTDRLDGDKLLAMLLRHHAGERVWSVLHEPSRRGRRRAPHAPRTGTADARAHCAHQPHRLAAGAAQPASRTSSSAGADWAGWWDVHGTQVPPLLRAEIERESARLALVKQQIKALEAAQREGSRTASSRWWRSWPSCVPSDPRAPGCWSRKLFGWRRFANRRELAGCVGLAPTPYASGDSQIEQGISKAGNKRARALLVELPGSWLRLQPDSELTQWFNRRFAAEASACGGSASWPWRGAW
jgi:transposase